MITSTQKLMSGARRIARDRSGNTLIITAFLIFPMIGMIGSGIDMSRAYMVKTRLQSACDAGVLAGRKAMANNGAYNADAKAKTNSMFNFNFDGNDLNATNTTFTHTANVEGQVIGSASTELPTLVMKTFGYTKFDLSVTCSAELQIANSDIMFVLDTTGSMGGTRIAGLREAVGDFHKTIAAAVTNDASTRIRYGFVPYSTSVNVSGLISRGELPTSYISTAHDYQTRLSVYDTPVYQVSNTADVGSATLQVYNGGEEIKQNECKDFANNSYPDDTGANPEYVSGSIPGTVRERYYSDYDWGYDGGYKKKDKTRKCRRTYQDRETTYVIGGYEFTKFLFKQDEIDTSNIRKNSIQIATGTAGTVSNAGTYDVVELLSAPGAKGILKETGTWEGCIEERDTVRDLTMNPVPSGAKDLDINSAPTNNATRWRPIWQDVEYQRGSTQADVESTWSWNNVGAPCPAPMMEFTTVDTVDATTVPTWLEDYLDDLNPEGNTYHDIGMIWGARLGSPRGIFKSNVDDGTVNSVSRHIIFMTDGILEPNYGAYTAYGMEYYDSRVAPSGTSSNGLKPYHNARFLAACDLAKAEGYTVWTVSFGTSVTQQLKDCSSNGRWYESSDTTALKDAFKAIASQIADLRLNQ